jgi:hypothetical protein
MENATTMIIKTITYACDRCGGINLVRNGTNKCGNRQYPWHDCGAYRVLIPQQGYPEHERAQVLRAYREGVSLRGLVLQPQIKGQQRLNGI